MMDSGARGIPLYLYNTPKKGSMFEVDSPTGRTPNLSAQARAYLEQIDCGGEDGAETLFYHALATMHAALYRVTNAGALRQDWPRIPLPAMREALERSAILGRQVAALLDSETPVPGVDTGVVRPDLRSVAALKSTGDRANFAVTVRWGYKQGGTVMPGAGRAVKEEDGTYTIWLNDTTSWAGLPDDVWSYTLGGYQVLKKWLSYRTFDLLGRALTVKEAETFAGIARRIAALLALADDLDANYEAVIANPTS